jgi:hypothetical protein
MRFASAMLLALSIVAGLASSANAACSTDKWNDSGNYPVWKCN